MTVKKPGKRARLANFVRSVTSRRYAPDTPSCRMHTLDLGWDGSLPQTDSAPVCEALVIQLTASLLALPPPAGRL